MAPPLPTFDAEQEFSRSLNGAVCGVDEAGRGAWAGPVVAGAVILNPDCVPTGLRDSKTISEKKREALGDAIWACARVGVGLASVAEIDQRGVGNATYLAMERAVADLPIVPVGALIDGLYAPLLPGIRTVTMVKGDARSLSIAAASIIAKTHRDGIMRSLHPVHPEFNWVRNKGYGAAAHRAALSAQTVTPHHRRSFAPIAKMLNGDEDTNDLVNNS